jgi:hypothetical protein
MKVATKVSGSMRPRQKTTNRSVSSASETRPSWAAITRCSAVRKLKRQVRAPKNPARWEASCTESEKVSSFLSLLKPEANSWAMITLVRLAAWEPIRVRLSCPPQYGQWWVEMTRPLDWILFSGRKTRTSSRWPQAAQASGAVPVESPRQDVHRYAIAPSASIVLGGPSSGKR